MPWWGKILLKIILSRLNISYNVWQKLRIFRHGAMDDPEYAFNTFNRHYNSGEFVNKGKNFTMMEIGPGDSLASGIIAFYYGAKKSFLVDVGDDAIQQTTNYKNLLEYLKNKKDINVNYKDGLSVDDIYKIWNISYLSDGLDSLKIIPDSSVDFIWSQSVLEHIDKYEFINYLRELRRIISIGGISVHGVDLKDHLSYAHNNLRFPEKVWESAFMKKSGFYTNRILYSDMIKILKDCNFHVEIKNIKRWDIMPTPRNKLDKQFCNFSDEDLMISEFDILLKPA